MEFIRLGNCMLRASEIQMIHVAEEKATVFMYNVGHLDIKFKSADECKNAYEQAYKELAAWKETVVKSTRAKPKFVSFKDLKINLDSIVAYCLASTGSSIVVYTMGGVGRMVLYFNSRKEATEAIERLETLLTTTPLENKKTKAKSH